MARFLSLRRKKAHAYLGRKEIFDALDRLKTEREYIGFIRNFRKDVFDPFKELLFTAREGVYTQIPRKQLATFYQEFNLGGLYYPRFQFVSGREEVIGSEEYKPEALVEVERIKDVELGKIIKEHSVLIDKILRRALFSKERDLIVADLVFASGTYIVARMSTEDIYFTMNRLLGAYRTKPWASQFAPFTYALTIKPNDVEVDIDTSTTKIFKAKYRSIRKEVKRYFRVKGAIKKVQRILSSRELGKKFYLQLSYAPSKERNKKGEMIVLIAFTPPISRFARGNDWDILRNLSLSELMGTFDGIADVIFELKEEILGAFDPIDLSRHLEEYFK